MNEVITINTTQKMTSLEIAELMEKRHDHVIRDIKKLIFEEAITAPRFGVSEYKDSTGRMLPMYLLDFHATMTLITGYDAKRRAMVIDRWIKLETGQASPMAELSETAPDYRDKYIAILEEKIQWMNTAPHAGPVTDEEAQAMRADILSGMTTAQVAGKYGRAKSTVREHTRTERAMMAGEQNRAEEV